jgi:predicted enzyme related to lactoylglutathione lyase
MIKEIAFTVYAVTDMKKSKEFYEGVLGLVPSTEFNSPNWTEYNIGSGTFAIGQSPEWKPSQDGATIAFEVDDFDAFTAKLKEKNVTFKMEPNSFPTCDMAVIKDPDLNNVLVHKRKVK